VLNSVISNELESLSKIFNDTKRRAVSLWQLSFLYYCVREAEWCEQIAQDCYETAVDLASSRQWRSQHQNLKAKAKAYILEAKVIGLKTKIFMHTARADINIRSTSDSLAG